MNEITALLRIGIAAVKLTNNSVNKDEDKKQKSNIYSNNIIKAFENKIQDIEVNIEK